MCHGGRYARNRSGRLPARLGGGQPGRVRASRRPAGRIRMAAVRVHETLAGALDGRMGTRPAWWGSTCRLACSSRAGARRTARHAACSGQAQLGLRDPAPGGLGAGQLPGGQPALPRPYRPGFQHPGLGAAGEAARGRPVPRNLRASAVRGAPGAGLRRAGGRAAGAQQDTAGGRDLRRELQPGRHHGPADPAGTGHGHAGRGRRGLERLAHRHRAGRRHPRPPAAGRPGREIAIRY